VLRQAYRNEIPDGYLGLPAQHSGNVESAMADRLLRDFVLDHGGISHALSTHLLGRHREGRPGLRDPTASFWAEGRARSSEIR
jgi:hypothetical protein